MGIFLLLLKQGKCIGVAYDNLNQLNWIKTTNQVSVVLEITLNDLVKNGKTNPSPNLTPKATKAL